MNDFLLKLSQNRREILGWIVFICIFFTIQIKYIGKFFEFLYYLGIINIIFGVVWKWIFLLPTAFLFTLINFDYGIRIIKIFHSYLLVSLTALFTLAALRDNLNIFTLVFYPFIGTLTLFIPHAKNRYDIHKVASMTRNLELFEKDSVFEILLMFAVVIFYIFTLFIPSLATNGLNQWLIVVINWIFNLPVIGWLIRIVGLFLLFKIILNGLNMMFYMTSSTGGNLLKIILNRNVYKLPKEE